MAKNFDTNSKIFKLKSSEFSVCKKYGIPNFFAKTVVNHLICEKSFKIFPHNISNSPIKIVGNFCWQFGAWWIRFPYFLAKTVENNFISEKSLKFWTQKTLKFRKFLHIFFEQNEGLFLFFATITPILSIFNSQSL